MDQAAASSTARRLGSSAGWAELGMLALCGVMSVIAYFLPTIVASRRSHHQAGPIAIVNIFLGWTCLGWIVALAWPCSAVRKVNT